MGSVYPQNGRAARRSAARILNHKEAEREIKREISFTESLEAVSDIAVLLRLYRIGWVSPLLLSRLEEVEAAVYQCCGQHAFAADASLIAKALSSRPAFSGWHGS